MSLHVSMADSIIQPALNKPARIKPNAATESHMKITTGRTGAERFNMDLSELIDILHPELNGSTESEVSTMAARLDELTNIVSQMVELMPSIVRRVVIGPLLDRTRRLQFADTSL